MDVQISKFWDRYVEKTVSYGVNEASIKWYVRYVEQYISAHKPKRLGFHNVDDMRAYLADIGRRGHLKDWQFRQLVMALKILFVDIIKKDWAASFPWDEQFVVAFRQTDGISTVESTFTFEGYSEDS